MTQPPAHLRPIFAHIQTGDLERARAAAEATLRTMPDSQPLLALAGMLACRTGDLPAGVGRLREALALEPADQATRNNLARALIEQHAFDEAGEVCAAGDRNPKSLRLSAYIHHQRGRLREAIADYQEVVAALPDDFESWNNLGNLHAAIGDGEGALGPLQRSIDLRPDIALPYINLSKILADLQRHDQRQAVMRAAAGKTSDEADVQLELGLAEAAARDFDAAERAYREAIRLTEGFTPAYLELAVLLETLNRVDALSALADEAIERGLTEAEIGFVRAWALRREGRFAEALPLALAMPETINPIRRAQLIGEIADRVGETAIAFAAFEDMNRAAIAEAPSDDGLLIPYFDEVCANAAHLTRDRIAGWSPIQVDPVPPSPIFLIGFPRSGTTLLDTLLMNIPHLHILEELPIIRSVENELGAGDRIANLSSDEANRLRRHYFEALDQEAPLAPGQRIVDKFPLHMARMGIIHRIFPDAKVIFAERHPCDVVLSCFMSNFELNRAMQSFTTLDGAARLYDAASTAWTRAAEHLPIDAHRVRYERMIDDLESEMRALLAFLDITWDPAVLDNRSSAAKRGHIRTASYSQVTEAIYRRSAGRWERYRDQMAPVLPILAPWAERMGYMV